MADNSNTVKQTAAGSSTGTTIGGSNGAVQTTDTGNGSGVWSGVSSGSSSIDTTGDKTVTTPSPTGEGSTTAANVSQQVLKNLEGVSIPTVDKVNIDTEKQIIQQLEDQQIEQANKQIDNATQTSVAELQRTLNDAQEDYQTQRNQIAADEQRALDNQVLTSEARGDRGGIGQAQYNTIQNTAATNRMTVNKEQTKLSTDTQRQIADLRAQGEFDKADKLLTITQNSLSQLLTLEQWAKEQNLSVDEFNAQIAEWEANYNMSLVDAGINLANATGAFADGTLTYTAWSNQQQQLASVANALMQSGIIPSAEQLAALGMSEEEAKKYVNYIRTVNSITTAS